jgi:exonuclease III
MFGDYLESNNFDIVGISETNLNESAARFAFKEQTTYKCFWSCNDKEPRGSGVGLLIKKEIAKHIQKILQFNGRCYYFFSLILIFFIIFIYLLFFFYILFFL